MRTARDSWFETAQARLLTVKGRCEFNSYVALQNAWRRMSLAAGRIDFPPVDSVALLRPLSYP
jgi:hypothetical protein